MAIKALITKISIWLSIHIPMLSRPLFMMTDRPLHVKEYPVISRTEVTYRNNTINVVITKADFLFYVYGFVSHWDKHKNTLLVGDNFLIVARQQGYTLEETVKFLYELRHAESVSRFTNYHDLSQNIDTNIVRNIVDLEQCGEIKNVSNITGLFTDTLMLEYCHAEATSSKLFKLKLLERQQLVNMWSSVLLLRVSQELNRCKLF